MRSCTAQTELSRKNHCYSSRRNPVKNLMKLSFALIILSLFAIQPALAQKNQQSMTKEEGQATFDAVLAEASELIKELKIPGLGIGVIHGPNAYGAGLGVTNVTTR